MQELKFRDLWTEKKALITAVKLKKVELAECEGYSQLLEQLVRIKKEKQKFNFFVIQFPFWKFDPWKSFSVNVIQIVEAL